MPKSVRIHVLNPTVARKIAAGEVIERPQSVVRELLDNSLDAGASNIDVHVEAGGNDLIRVVDDGSGMSSADLKLCYLPHATSKISTDADLLNVRSLGFRGEALASIAAVSRLTVISREHGSDSAYRLLVEDGRLVEHGISAGAVGTTVDVAGLFYNMPARKQFLKRPQSEYAMVKSIINDRALAHPGVGFRLFSAGELKLFYPAATLRDRLCAVYADKIEPGLLQELTAAGDGFELTALAGEPSASRRDRKLLQLFVNGRRVREYGLLQAVEYAYRDYLHGGLYATCFLFIECSPEHVDFNIHPAKREVRIRILPRLHHEIVQTLGAFLRGFNRTAASRAEPTDELPGLSKRSQGAPGTTRGDRPVRANAVYDLSRSFEVPQQNARTWLPDGEVHEDAESGFRYLGQLFALFLVVEKGDTLYLVDQHAAHEKIIYDRLRSGSPSQELLVPVRFESEPEESSVLQDHLDHLQRLGIRIVKSTDTTWEIVGVPSSVNLPTEDLVEMVLDLAAQPSDFERELYASMSCRAAVMDGDVVAPETAMMIIRESLSMQNARCPHGRPLWAEFSRERLMQLVGRI